MKLETSSTGTVLSALRKAKHVGQPFDYWLLSDVLPTAVCRGIAGLPVPAPAGHIFDGRRESNNSTRVYASPENQQLYPVLREVAGTFQDREVRHAIEATTGTDLSQGRLRIEYCQDVDGFWLEPHVDISVKLFTMLVYLSEDPALRDAGTDIYDASPEHALVANAPYIWNAGLIFIPGKDTWHGFTKRPIHGVRKSIIINYVSPAWRAVEELA